MKQQIFAPTATRSLFTRVSLECYTNFDIHFPENFFVVCVIFKVATILNAKSKKKGTAIWSNF